MATLQTGRMTHLADATARRMFDVDQEDVTLILVPTSDLRELNFDRIEADAGLVFERLKDETVKNVVVDFSETDLFGSSALGFFLNVWKKVKYRNGRMVFCNVSDHEQDMLRATRLDHFWPIHSTRAEAMMSIKDDPDPIWKRPSQAAILLTS